MWFSEVKSMPVSKASVQALQQFLLQFPTGSVAANARVLLDQQQAQLQDPLSAPARKGWRRSSPGIPRRRSRICRKPFRPTAATATRWALSARPIPSAATARGQWRSSSKAIAMDPDSPNRGKWDSLLQTNRYWLLIKQGDNALKAGQLSQAQNYYAQAQRVDRTDSYAVLGLGDVAAARKEAAAERYYQQALRLDRGNNLAVRGLANLYRAESPEKASAWIAGLPPAQRRSIDDIERSLT